MGLLSVILLACALAMDAFAVSLCKGFAVKRLEIRHYLIVGAYFGGFQALMPSAGYLLGGAFAEFVSAIDHYIAFVLLFFVGAKMIKESFEAASCDTADAHFEAKTMLALAVATSIDALAIGVSFAFIDFGGLNFGSNTAQIGGVWVAILIIGILTAIICAVGLNLGHRLGAKSTLGARLGKKAELIGGLVLIFLGSKILIEHLS